MDSNVANVIRSLLDFPNARCCRHWAALQVLDQLVKCPDEELVEAIIDSNDESALSRLNHLTNMYVTNTVFDRFESQLEEWLQSQGYSYQLKRLDRQRPDSDSDSVWLLGIMDTNDNVKQMLKIIITSGLPELPAFVEVLEGEMTGHGIQGSASSAEEMLPYVQEKIRS